MMSPRWQKVFADIWGHKFRSLLVIASITIGLFATGLIVSMDLIISQDMKTGYAAVNPANIEIFASPFNQDLVDSVRHIDGVAPGGGRANAHLAGAQHQGRMAADRTASHPGYRNDGHQPGEPEAGRLAAAGPPGGHRRVPLEARWRRAWGARSRWNCPRGQSANFPSWPSPTTRPSARWAPADSSSRRLQGYITFATLDWLESPQLMNRLYMTVQDNPNDRAHLQDDCRPGDPHGGRQRECRPVFAGAAGGRPPQPRLRGRDFGGARRARIFGDVPERLSSSPTRWRPCSTSR